MAAAKDLRVEGHGWQTAHLAANSGKNVRRLLNTHGEGSRSGPSAPRTTTFTNTLLVETVGVGRTWNKERRLEAERDCAILIKVVRYCSHQVVKEASTA